ncbi:MAG: glutamate-5-semialdehyde dehydrogenase [Ruminococcaceae bacterium]|nr:glutamate-5-semialdehyde dehydrogenase [Oscillospiraceae bacterium]
MTTKEILENAKSAKKQIALLSKNEKNKLLLNMANSLIENTESILEANKIDIEKARETVGGVMIDRLTLTADRIKSMSDGIREVAELPDPVGRVISENDRRGMKIKKVSVPIGTVAIIYESRPNVTSDAASLCIKSGNACVLRGGKEAYNSNKAVVGALKEGITKSGYSPDFINLIEDTTRASAHELMTAVGYVDLLIPRGGKGLISACVEGAKVPCIQTGTGICHIYVDETADFQMALNIIDNAKTSRPSVCNAAEVLLVNKNIANEFLPLLFNRLVTDRKNKGLIPVELRLDDAASGIIKGKRAESDDFDTEFLDYILAVRCVENVNEAVEHISAHSTGHSEAIITNDNKNAEFFTLTVDSAAVYVNASTRFTDGGEFGLGCEMGISTQKLHARGPMGLEELNTYKYVINGNGEIR